MVARANGDGKGAVNRTVMMENRGKRCTVRLVVSYRRRFRLPTVNMVTEAWAKEA